jgi:F-type H+-transporting ATPase subunit a
MDNTAPATDNPVIYIQHHLSPLATGEGFWRINIDTMFFSMLLASIVMFIAYRVGKNVSAGAPSGMQNVLESLMDFVNSL